MKDSGLSKCRKISLDPIVDDIVAKEKIKEKPSHADYILVCKDVLFIVEEANKPKTEDIEQIDKTKDLIERYRDYFIQIIGSNIPRKIKGIVHGRFDPMVYRLALSKGYVCAGCEQELASKILR